MSDKSPEIMGFLNGMTEAIFGRSFEDCMFNGVCVGCHGAIEEYDFRDEMSKKEYTISGFCQSCQDKTFVDPDENC